MKKKVLSLAVAVGLLTGGTTYAATSYFTKQEQELKERYTVEVMQFSNDREHFKAFKEQEAARIQKETSEYLQKKISEKENAAKKEITAEANQVINNIKKHIDKEIGGF